MPTEMEPDVKVTTVSVVVPPVIVAEEAAAASRTPAFMVTAVPTADTALKKYVPAPPVAVPSAMMVVPAYTPVPEMGMPTEREPEITTVTVSVELAMVPRNVAPTLAPAYITAVATVEGWLSVYAPVPPVPPASAVITVPA